MSSSARLQSIAARGALAITAPQPCFSARQTSRSTNGSSSEERARRPPAALSISQSGYSRPECGTDSSKGRAPRCAWMTGEASGVTINFRERGPAFCASLGLA